MITTRRTHTFFENKVFSPHPYQAFRWRPRRLWAACEVKPACRDAELDQILASATPWDGS